MSDDVDTDRHPGQLHGDRPDAHPHPASRPPASSHPPPPPPPTDVSPLSLSSLSSTPNSDTHTPSAVPSANLPTALPRMSTLASRSAFRSSLPAARPMSTPYPNMANPADTPQPHPPNLNPATSSFYNSTSRLSTPVSTNAAAAALPRGSTFYKGSSRSPNNDTPIQQTPTHPRLRRGSTTIMPSNSPSPPSSTSSTPQQQPRLRRGSTMMNGHDNPLADFNSGFRRSVAIPHGGATFLKPSPNKVAARNNFDATDGSNALPRAGTFAFGARPGSLPAHRANNPPIINGDHPAFRNNAGNRTSVRLSSSRPPPSAKGSIEHSGQNGHEDDGTSTHGSKESSGRGHVPDKNQTCGMCGNCQTGSKALPPWAPERLREMKDDERSIFLAEMRAKERKGQLDRELRERRIRDAQTASSEHGGSANGNANGATFRRRGRMRRTDDPALRSGRRQASGAGGDDDATDSGTYGEDDDDVRVVEEDDDFLDGDLDEVKIVDEEHDSGSLNESGRKHDSKTVRSDVDQEDDCEMCQSLEDKVLSLEQQLDVLREVVKLCSSNEADLERERAEADKSLKRSKTWMGRITNPFQNAAGAAAAAERAKLREEVDVLRKATDFLFQKLEQTSSHQPPPKQ